jgi:hypothetical protein
MVRGCVGRGKAVNALYETGLLCALRNGTVAPVRYFSCMIQTPSHASSGALA